MSYQDFEITHQDFAIAIQQMKPHWTSTQVSSLAKEAFEVMYLDDTIDEIAAAGLTESLDVNQEGSNAKIKAVLREAGFIGDKPESLLQFSEGDISKVMAVFCAKTSEPPVDALYAMMNNAEQFFKRTTVVPHPQTNMAEMDYATIPNFVVFMLGNLGQNQQLDLGTNEPSMGM
jgi:hypothetical protein